MRFAKYLTVVVLIVASVTLAANPRNRQKVGYRGRTALQLVGRQASNTEPQFGISSDPVAALMYQTDGPAVPTTGQPCSMYIRVPIQVQAQNGDLLQFCQVNSANADSSGYAVIMRRSTDKGRTWSAVSTVYTHSAFVAGTEWINFGSVVVDTLNTGAITVLYTQATTSVHRVWITRSTDNGATWGASSEITSTVKVVNGSTPPGHTYGSTPWTQCVGGESAGIQLTMGANRGRLIIPCDHRVTDFVSPSWSHTIKSDDGGATWSLHGGVTENASNQYSNECAITETATADRLIMHCRYTNGSNRYQSISTDGGATWSTIAQLANVFGGGSSGAAGDVKKIGNYLVAACSADPNNGGTRNSLAMFISRDDGVTWTATDKRMLRGRPVGYVNLNIVGTTAVCTYEESQGNTAGSSVADFSHAISCVRVDLNWLLNPTVRYSEWFFNEDTGAKAITLGGTIWDYGNLDERATGGTLAAPPLYTSTGLLLDNGADYIQLSPVSDPAFDAYTDQSLTVEIEATIAPGTNGALVTRHTSSTGFILESVSGNLKLTIQDGTNTVTLTGTSTINNGVRRTYAFMRDAVRDKVGIYVNGSLDQTEANDTTVSIAQQSVGCFIGQRADASTQLEAVVHSARITRGVVTNFIAPNRTKKNVDQLRRSNTLVASTPTTISGLKFWGLQTYNGGANAATDAFVTERPSLPWPTNVGLRSEIDGSPNRRPMYASEVKRWRYVTDTKMGPCWINDYGASSPGALYNTNLYGATNGYDFIQNTCTFTIAFCVNFRASTGGLQTILNTNRGTAANPGVLIYRNNGATSKLSTFVTVGGSNSRVSETVATAPNMPYGSTFFVAIRGNGIGSTFDLFVADITANYDATNPTAPTVNKYTSSGTMAVQAGAPFTTGSGNYLEIGTISSTTNGLDGSLKNVLIYDTAVSDGNIQLLANFCTSQ